MFCFAAWLPFAAHAIGLGAATLSSGLGEPLRLSFPVSLQPNEEAGCVQVRAKGDDLPSVLNTRSSLIRNGFQTRIEVSSAQPVNEPAIGIVVSVGCASPVAREYVLFLDPPIVAATAASTGETAPFRARDVGRRAVPRRQPSAGAADGASTAASPDAVAKPATRAARPRTRSTPSAAAGSAPRRTATAPAPTAGPRAATSVDRAGDRLTVAPTEPAGGPIAPSAGPNPAAGANAASGSNLPAPAVAAAGTTPAAAVGAAATAAVPTPPGTDAGAPAVPPTAAPVGDREEALRVQQVDLQNQVKSLGDQIAALRVQTTTLASRNQVLESSALSPTLVWLLLGLAVLALLAAGWMAWRNTQLRRSTNDPAWWAGNTVLEGGGASVLSGDALANATLDPGRIPARPPATRSSTQSDARISATSGSAVPATTSQSERARAPARAGQFGAAMDTDFTVSDIEAAMATVRTVSPPREVTRPSFEDSDFAPLGGASLPSPFTQPPPVTRTSKVVERDGDDLGKFVDLDIPPFPTARVAAPASRAASAPSAADASTGAKPPTSIRPLDVSEPLDFKLDIPQAFDPLATDSLKTTIVDPADPIDFELSATPTALDFELPSTTAIGAAGHAGSNSEGAMAERHGATALDDLFAPLGGPGPDTILNLDDAYGSPLSTTEVDRLTTTAVDATNADASSTRARLTRFADLMNQVDEAADHDPLRAIAQLRQHVLRDEQIPTLLWLRLFELYKTVDKKPVYEALSEHFTRRYHRPMIRWDEQLADRAPQTPLAAMGEIDREIEALWGREEGLERLRSLLCDRDQDDVVVFNAVLQRDLLDAAKVFPRVPNASPKA